ncbi:MAG: type II toxin-antitoxin system RelE/ParE family toxin [Candidatus Methanoperedens sp.]|nr:type II toxin-antitoxin system RelE/ParE family toxin [Candidatus Methanoperedens sp.]
MKLIYTDEFKRDLKKIRDGKIQARAKKIIQKIIDDPEIGKTMRYELFPLRSVRIPPFRVLYEFKGDILILHKFEHRKTVYK